MASAREMLTVEAVQAAGVQVINGVGDDDIVAGLVADGHEEALAREAVKELRIVVERDPEAFLMGPEDVRAAERRKAGKLMLTGAAWAVGGLAVTLVTHGIASGAPAGGSYVVAWGAMLIGGLEFLVGAVRFAKLG